MKKHQLREIYKARRAAFTPQEVQEKSIGIANKLLDLDIWNYDNYHLFLPIESKNEVDTTHILNILLGRDKNVILSRSNFTDGTMSHYLLTDVTRLELNLYGIPEPVENSIPFPVKDIQVVFVPMLISDKNGHRVGYGKGFYDRFLVQCASKTVKIGLSFFAPVKKITDVNYNDVNVDFTVNI